MNETIIKNSLGFLCSEYGFDYQVLEFDNYLNRGGTLIAYNYFNGNGCFTIANVPVIGDVTYYRFDSIDQLKKYTTPAADSLSDIGGCELNIFSYEKQIWKSHEELLGFKNPFAYLTDKRILNVLHEVIQAQLQSRNEFFGIKNKED